MKAPSSASSRSRCRPTSSPARVLADVSGVPSDKMRRGDLSDRDYEQIREAAASMENIPLYIDDMGGISISQLAARARRLQRTTGLDLLIIDYLQLITPAGNRKNDGRVQEVTEITKSLKALAKELHIPVIALSQLSRAVENPARTSGRSSPTCASSARSSRTPTW